MDYEKNGEIINVQSINEYEDILIIRRYSGLSLYKVTNNNGLWEYSIIDPLTEYEVNGLNYLIVKHEFASSAGECYYIYLGRVFNDNIENLVSEDSSLEFNIFDSFVMSEITANSQEIRIQALNHEFNVIPQNNANK